MRRMGSVGHVASVGEMRNNLVLKAGQKKPVGGGGGRIALQHAVNKEGL
jgi:hypothetical protein